MMTFAWASQTPKLRQRPLQILEDRFKKADITCRYYTPALHLASFALPQYLLNLLAKKAQFYSIGGEIDCKNLNYMVLII
ncbi:MAG: hypothetical protein ACL7BU_11245 [Candidatus Phlomobacter fragariae]